MAHGRRQTVLGIMSLGILSLQESEMMMASAEEPVRPAVTERVYLDVGVCPDGYKKDRRLGDTTILCDTPDSIGTIVVELYGQNAPDTVANFVELIRSGALVGSTVNRCFERNYIIAGQQGSHRMGLLDVNGKDMFGKVDLKRNRDVLESSSFLLKHERPGTVSLNLSKNLDDEFYRNKSGYIDLSFLITTGPGPVPSLDEENIVFGRVCEGMDVIARVSEVPTFKPNKSLQVFSDLATVIGDERIQKKQGIYGKPLNPIVFTRTGVLEGKVDLHG